MGKRYEAYGWHVQTSTGAATGPTQAAHVRRGRRRPAGRDRGGKAISDKPTLVILKTVIAWPAPTKQNTGKAHGSALGDEEVAATKGLLGFDPATDVRGPP